MITPPTEIWRSHLRSSLTTARKERDSVRAADDFTAGSHAERAAALRAEAAIPTDLLSNV